MYVPVRASFHHSLYRAFLLQIEHPVLTGGKNTLFQPDKLLKKKKKKSVHLKPCHASLVVKIGNVFYLDGSLIS